MNPDTNRMSEPRSAIENGTDQSDILRPAGDDLACSIRRAPEGEVIATSYRELPQGSDEDAAALANAITMTEAEPWWLEVGR